MSKKPKKIVCLGGGNAMPNTILSELKNYDVEISSISSMSDSGGSAGEERRRFGTPVTYGDIRRAAYSLSGAPADVRDFLNKRLENKEDIEKACEIYPIIKPFVLKNPERFKGHVLSNIIASCTDKRFGPIRAIENLNEIFKISPNKTFGVTISGSPVLVELEGGKKIKGEVNIDIPKHDPNLKIVDVLLDPPAEAYHPAVEAIKKADLITIGPGDLFSSIAQILLVGGISEAINQSQAKKVYICNLMTKNGETNGFSVLDFAGWIGKLLNGNLNFVTIHNKEKPSPKRLEEYKKEHPELINMVDFNENLDKSKFIGANVLVSSGPIVHDSKKLAKILLRLL